MNINRANSGNPVTPPVNGEEGDTNENPNIPIVGVQQAANQAPITQGQRVSVIVSNPNAIVQQGVQQPPVPNPFDEAVPGPSGAAGYDPFAIPLEPFELLNYGVGLELEGDYRRQPYDGEVKARALALHGEGYSLRAIKVALRDEFGDGNTPSHTTISRWIKNKK